MADDVDSESTRVDPLVPTIPGYRLVRLLGQGGLGRVFLAEEVALGRRVAVKLLSSKVSDDQDSRARFLREARAMASVEHPNVVRVYGLGEAGGAAFLVMEYVEGESLAERIKKKGRLPSSDVIQLGQEVTEALAAAWARGIVHRDVKPSNILLDKRGQAHVADFGLAKSLDQDADGSLTHTGMVLGTPHYISPEAARGQPADPRSDVYSVGIVLFEALTGERPFRAPTPLGVVAQHLSERLPSLREKVPEAPSALVDLVERMADKDAGARPSELEIRKRFAELTRPPLPRASWRLPGKEWRIPGLLVLALVALAAGGYAVRNRAGLSAGSAAPPAGRMATKRVQLAKPWSRRQEIDLPRRAKGDARRVASLKKMEGATLEISAPEQDIETVTSWVHIADALEGHWASGEPNLFTSESPSPRRISLDVTETSLVGLVHMLVDAAGMPSVIDDGVGGEDALRRTATLKLLDTPWDLALQQILRVSGLRALRQGDVWLISTRARAEQIAARQNPTEWQFSPKRVSLERLASALGGAASDTGVLATSGRLRSVVITDSAEALGPYFRVVAALERVNEKDIAGPGPRYNGERCKLSHLEGDGQDYFRWIADFSGLNVVVEPGLAVGPLTVATHGVGVPWDNLLDVVLETWDLTFELQDSVLRIYAPSKEDQSPSVETVRLTNEDPEFFRPFAKSLTSTGSLFIDASSRTLVIKDVRNRARWFKAFAEKIDQQP